MALTITTDPSGNRVETKPTYTDASGYEVVEATTYYGEKSYGTLFKNFYVWWFFVVMILGFIFGFFVYWLLSKLFSAVGGKTGLLIYTILIGLGTIYYIVKLATMDRNNVVTTITRTKANEIKYEYKGRFQIGIYADFVSNLAGIFLQLIFAGMAYKKYDTYVETSSNGQSGGRWKGSRKNSRR